MTKPKVTVFTDGACSGNPGPGGWAAILRFKDTERELSGHERHTTNNRMELMAAIEALKTLKTPCHVTLVTDSQYLKNGITTWITDWKKRGWKTSNKKPVKNLELWRALEDIVSKHKIEWQWIRSHTGHPENERVDELARAAIELIR